MFIYNLYYLIYYFIFPNYFQSKFDFIISQSSEIFEFIAFLIYLEIIELRFCGLNKNTKKNIILRAEFDFEGEINMDESLIEGMNITDIDEEDNDKNELQLFNSK